MNGPTMVSEADGAHGVLAQDKEMAREFLAALDPKATGFTFQIISDAGSGQTEIFHGSLDEFWPKVEASHNLQQQCGVFVTPNETDFKGRKNKNIVRVRALFVDADGREQVERCEWARRFGAAAPGVQILTNTGAGRRLAMRLEGRPALR